MENTETSMTRLPQRSEDTQKIRESLIEEWIVRLAINAGAALDAQTQAVYRSLWVDGLADLPINVLNSAFVRTLQTCCYWPVKVADIRKHVIHAKENAQHESAEAAWQHILDLRRRYWNPDMLGGFSRDMPKLSDHLSQAARASGIFRDFESVEALHVWAKKTFIESFLRYEEMQQNKFLLPDGAVKDAIDKLAKVKSLPE